MFRKVSLLILLVLTSYAGIAQAAAEHYFGIGASNSTWPEWQWLEITVKLNGVAHTKTFDANGVYPFSLAEMDMSKQGSIQVTQVRYQEGDTGNIYTLPLIDNGDCSAQVIPKNGYPDSTIWTIYVSTTGCVQTIRPYSPTKNE